MLLNLLFVGFGGFIGASLRYATGLFVGRFITDAHFPYGTFVVNMLGCLLIGFLAGLTDLCELMNDTSRAFVFTGMLGAFTTFSTFSYETMGLLQNGHTSPALTNLGLQIILGLLAVWVGIQLSKLI